MVISMLFVLFTKRLVTVSASMSMVIRIEKYSTPMSIGRSQTDFFFEVRHMTSKKTSGFAPLRKNILQTFSFQINSYFGCPHPYSTKEPCACFELSDSISNDAFRRITQIAGANFMMLLDRDINGVALASDVSIKLFNLRNKHRRIVFTKDRLLRFSPLILYRKNSVLIRVFNTQLQALIEAGLIDYWTKTYTDTHKSNAKQKPPSKIRLGNVAAVFKICTFIHVVSIIVFVLEMITVNSRRIKIVLDYLTY